MLTNLKNVALDLSCRFCYCSVVVFVGHIYLFFDLRSYYQCCNFFFFWNFIVIERGDFFFPILQNFGVNPVIAFVLFRKRTLYLVSLNIKF